MAALRALCVGFAAFVALFCAENARAHEQHGAHYLGNEGVLVVSGAAKVLFDPFFHGGLGVYQAVPAEIRAALYAGTAPFDGVDAVFISHAHADHFDAADVLAYLKRHAAVILVAPEQAVAQLRAHALWEEGLSARVKSLKLLIGGPAERLQVRTNDAVLEVFAARIAHAGWPNRTEVENIIYRVQANTGAIALHLGDSDAKDQHFAPYSADFQALRTHIAFPPFWFFGSEEARAILEQRLNAEKVVGVHVPKEVPANLKAAQEQSGFDLFTTPGEVRIIDLSSAKAGK